jgi:hypothetical protein
MYIFRAAMIAVAVMISASVSTAEQFAPLADPTGTRCNTLTFEGLANDAPIPPVIGVASPTWHALIDMDAGGTGNVAFEPSASTIAYWTGTETARDLVFDPPVHSVRVSYTAMIPVTLTAYDAQNVILATANGAANVFTILPPINGDPNGAYNAWTPLEVSAAGNRIRRVTVSAADQRFAIDDLRWCRALQIESVDWTPNPPRAGVALTVRVYPSAVPRAAAVQIRVNGIARDVQLQPHCPPDAQRNATNGCEAASVVIPNPTAGNYPLTVELWMGGALVQRQIIPLVVQPAAPPLSPPQPTADLIPPALTLILTTDGAPTACAAAFIDVRDTESGVVSLDYSLNGGAAWTNIPLSAIPFRAIPPTPGYIDLVVAARDAAGNRAVSSETFFVGAPCPANLLNNPAFDAPVGSDPAGGWAVYAPPGESLPYRQVNGVFEFYRPANTTQGVIFQQTLTAIPAGVPLDVMVDIGNSSARRKRITLIVWDANFADVRACTFWLPPRAPLRPYRMLTVSGIDWASATLHLYASSADGEGWYQIDNLSLRYNMATTRTATLCIDPNAPR